MKNLLWVLIIISFCSMCTAEEKIVFDDYFLDKTLRIDFYMTGNFETSIVSPDQMYEYDGWAGNPKKTIDELNNGMYYIKIYNKDKTKLLFSKGYSDIFGEYKTTASARQGEYGTYHESAIVPYPKEPVIFVLEEKDRKYVFHPIFTTKIDPKNPNIIKSKPNPNDKVYESLISGDPHKKVDFVFVGEGYTADQWDKFKKDVDRFSGVFFRAEPYKSNKDKFNIRGVMRPSPEAGVDEPRQGKFRNTVVSASYNALDLDRYLLVDDTKAMRDIASNVPYDTLLVMSNTSRYGGGGIYNNYTIFTADDNRSEGIIMHEFGHGFGGLADEYFGSTVSYDEFFPAGVEPTEGNITALLDPNNVKWKHLLSPGIPIPTPWGNEEIEKLDNPSRAEINAIREKYKKLYDGKVGVFEGAGYQPKGLYRSEIEINMFSFNKFSYGPVSEEAILKAINHYAD